MELSEPVKVCVKDFKLLALQIGPNFSFKDAQAAGVFSSYRSQTLGHTLNQLKELAGLPCQKRRLSTRNPEDKPIRAKRPEGYTPRYHDKRPKGPAVKLCLGYADASMEADCKRKVAKGEYFCPRCKARKDATRVD